MWRIAILIILCLAISLPAQAKPNKAKRSSTSQKQVTEQTGQFSPAERHLIRSQLLQKPFSPPGQTGELPRGLKKKVARGKPLPPGWQKKLISGRSLDYAVYRQGLPLPQVLTDRLPPAPPGSEIIRVIDKIIRIYTGTRIIIDSFDLTPAN